MSLPSYSLKIPSVLAASLLSFFSASAADYQWDNNGATVGLGTNGTTAWANANAVWDLLGTGLDDGTDATSAVALTASDNITFAPTAGNVTIASQTKTVGNMTFSTTGYAIRGYGNGRLTVGGLTTLASGGTTTFTQAANNHDFQLNGGIALNGGDLALNLRGTLNGGAPSSATGVTGTGNITLANELTTAANARFILKGTNTFTGTTTVNGIILDLNSETALGGSASVLTINATNAGNTTVIRNTSAGALTLANNNPMNWNGNFTFSDSTTARVGSSGGTTRDLNMGTGAVTLGGNRIVTTTANTLTIGGVIDDGANDFSLTKSGAARLNLEGINTYSGNTIVTAGTLSLLQPYLADASSVSIGATGILDLAHATSDTVDKLFINGAQQTTGTWGSTVSGATHQDDAHFTGSGTLTVTSAPDPLIVVASTVTAPTNSAPTALSIPVSNNGATQTLTISAIAIGGANASSFVVTSTLPINIAPGGSSTINYTFTPTAGPGAYIATFDISSNDLTQSPKTVTLNVTDNPDPWIVAANASLSNNGVAAVYSVDVSNNGNANPLTLGTVTAGGVNAGSVSGITAPASILPGQSGNIQFTFTPEAGPGAYTFTLSIPSNTPGTPSKEITITMTVKEPVIAVNIMSINYGLFAHAPGPQVQTVTVTNNGGAQNLTISSATITGAPEFTVTSAPTSIAPGASAPVQITFTPGSGAGRINGTLQIFSNDFNGTTPSIALTAFVEPAGTVAARFNFDPISVTDTIVDIDATTLADVVLGSLTDVATGIGALSVGNQTISNREMGMGINGNYLNFSSNRETDAQTPVATGGGNEITWTTFSIAPEPGGGQINFTGGAAVVDTYASTSLATATAANWTLYYSTDAGSTWTALGAAAPGQATTTNGIKGPLGLTWDLSVIGNQTASVLFALDAVSTGNANGTVSQRGVGFDNLVITAGSVTPGSPINFAAWAYLNGVTGGVNGDSDNDGIPNLVEYALNLNFAGSDGSAGTLTGSVLSFTKRAQAVTNGDVTYAIETSPDLITWTPVPYVLPDVNNGTTISYTLPTGLGKIFARQVVTQVP